MMAVDKIGQIRRAFFERHLPIKEIVRTLSVSRATVRKVIRGKATEFRYERGVQPAPKLGEWVEVLTEILEKEASLPRRERRSTQRLFEELRGRGYDGAHDSVHRFARAWRNERAQARVPVQAFVPLSFAPGEAYQFDWSHETITLQGLPLTIKAAHMKLSHSRLTLDEIIRLHGVLIEDMRFTRVGLRPDGVFLGERDHQGDPLPEFIGARPTDLADLMSGSLEANDRMRDDELNPVLQAAATAFGFVYVHPFQDGNGRVHRCLIHGVLAERKFTPPGMVFPVSSVMLDRIDDYRTTLQDHSGPLMRFIEWRPTSNHNVEVLNETADLYRYFDCTSAAEFLYACVARTVEHDLPHEIDYLRRHDEAIHRIMNAVEMPDQLAENLVMFIRQNKGTLSKKRRADEYEKLRDDEVALLEGIVRDAFTGFEEDDALAADPASGP